MQVGKKDNHPVFVCSNTRICQMFSPTRASLMLIMSIISGTSLVKYKHKLILFQIKSNLRNILNLNIGYYLLLLCSTEVLLIILNPFDTLTMLEKLNTVICCLKDRSCGKYNSNLKIILRQKLKWKKLKKRFYQLKVIK